MTTTANDLIEVSIREHRCVAEYPDTREEFESLLDDLLASSDGSVDTAAHSGAGHSGPEARGWTEIWSEDGWRIDLVNPPR